VLVHLTGAVICALILGVTLYEKLAHGAWLTVVITGGLVALCFLVRRHYRRVAEAIRSLDKTAVNFVLSSPSRAGPHLTHRLDPSQSTAVILVSKYGGLGTHTMMQVLEDFPGHFKQIVFVGVATVDANVLKDQQELDKCQMALKGGLQRYVQLARRLGVSASFEMALGTEVTTKAVPLCAELARRYAQTVVFGGRLILSRDPWYQRLLHNDSAYAIQRRLQELGVPMLVMPTCLDG
jgi:K+ transporter